MSTSTAFLRTFGEYLLKKNLQHLIVHVTNRCNYRCEHCFIDFSRKQDLTLSQLQSLARQVGKLYWLDIAGGEPFLRKDLAEIVAAFDAQFVQIPSNGSLHDLIVDNLTRLKRLTKAKITISLSLDGLPETHAKIRHNDKSWDDVWSAFEKIRSVGDVAIKINTVITRSNIDEIIPLMKLVRERSPDFHSIILLRGTPLEPHVALPSVDELRRIAPEIFTILNTYDYGQNSMISRILRNYHRFLWKTSLRTIEQQRQVIPCYAGKFHMVVLSDGQVSSCEMLKPVGNINHGSFNTIKQSRAFKDQVKSIERGECHCTHNCAMLGSILFNPANVIKLIKKPAI